MRFSTLSGLTFNPDEDSRLESVTTMWPIDTPSEIMYWIAMSFP